MDGLGGGSWQGEERKHVAVEASSDRRDEESGLGGRGLSRSLVDAGARWAICRIRVKRRESQTKQAGEEGITMLESQQISRGRGAASFSPASEHNPP